MLGFLSTKMRNRELCYNFYLSCINYYHYFDHCRQIMDRYMHPASKYGFDQLLSGLEELVAGGNVAKKICPLHGKYVLYNYKSIVKVCWTELMLCARGIILDIENKEIVALPFPKFFNHNEHPPKTWPPVAAVEEKVDGSLGIVFWDKMLCRWRVNTRGSFVSPQSAIAEDLLESVDLTHVPHHFTLLMEILGAETRVVVKYEDTRLTLLSAFDTRTGQEQPRDVLEGIVSAAPGLHLIRRRDDLVTVEDIKRTLTEIDGHTQEGWVVQFQDGSRRKFKGDSYLALHRLLSDVTPKRIWAVMSCCPDASTSMATLQQQANLMPEEHYADAMNIGEELLGQFRDLEEALRTDLAAIEEHNMTDREVGLCIKKPQECDFEFSLPPKARGLIFSVRAGKNVCQEIWKNLQPKK
jgi:RNA ligase